MKHAGQRATARVRVHYLDDAVEIEVDDTGPATTAPAPAAGDGQGHGLVGMRERVAMLGGRLDAGPCRGGGFRVHAWLPLEVVAT
jgi:signal transduction histidine kinase